MGIRRDGRDRRSGETRKSIGRKERRGYAATRARKGRAGGRGSRQETEGSRQETEGSRQETASRYTS